MQESGSTERKLVEWTPRDTAGNEDEEVQKESRKLGGIRFGELRGKHWHAKLQCPPRMQRKSANAARENPTE
jgi:hypothetical protein